MALTQFGFMGIGLVRSKMVGVHYASEEELKGFLHLWRIVGHVLGIEDRLVIFWLCTILNFPLAASSKKTLNTKTNGKSNIKQFFGYVVDLDFLTFWEKEEGNMPSSVL